MSGIKIIKEVLSIYYIPVIMLGSYIISLILVWIPRNNNKYSPYIPSEDGKGHVLNNY